MYLYNISVIVEDHVHHTFLHWLKNEWLPHIHEDVKLLKLLDVAQEGYTYCVQFVANNESDIQVFRDNHLIVLQQHIGGHYAEKVFLFDSTMQYLS